MWYAGHALILIIMVIITFVPVALHCFYIHNFLMVFLGGLFIISAKYSFFNLMLTFFTLATNDTCTFWVPQKYNRWINWQCYILGSLSVQSFQMNPSNGYGTLLTPLLFLFIHPPTIAHMGLWLLGKDSPRKGCRAPPSTRESLSWWGPATTAPARRAARRRTRTWHSHRTKKSWGTLTLQQVDRCPVVLSVLMNNWRWILKSHLLHSYFRPSQLPFRARHQPDPIVIMYWKWKTTLLGLHKLCLSHILRLKFICHDFFFFGMAFPHFFDEARFRTSHFLFFLMCLVFREKPFKNRLKRLRIETLWSCLLEDLLFWISSVAVCEVSWVECRIYTSLIDY